MVKVNSPLPGLVLCLEFFLLQQILSESSPRAKHWGDNGAQTRRLQPLLGGHRGQRIVQTAEAEEEAKIRSERNAWEEGDQRVRLGDRDGEEPLQR